MSTPEHTPYSLTEEELSNLESSVEKYRALCLRQDSIENRSKLKTAYSLLLQKQDRNYFYEDPEVQAIWKKNMTPQR